MRPLKAHALTFLVPPNRLTKHFHIQGRRQVNFWGEPLPLSPSWSLNVNWSIHSLQSFYMRSCVDSQTHGLYVEYVTFARHTRLEACSDYTFRLRWFDALSVLNVYTLRRCAPLVFFYGGALFVFVAVTTDHQNRKNAYKYCFIGAEHPSSDTWRRFVEALTMNSSPQRPTPV